MKQDNQQVIKKSYLLWFLSTITESMIKGLLPVYESCGVLLTVSLERDLIRGLLEKNRA